MAKKPETTFIESVHDHLPPGRENPYWMKNNNEYTSGIADCWYSGKQADLWIEYKFLDKIPVKEAFVPALSALQVDWCKKRSMEGRNVAVVVGCKEGGVIFDNCDWENPITNAAFKVRIQSRKEIAEWIMARTSPPQRKPRK